MRLLSSLVLLLAAAPLAAQAAMTVPIDQTRRVTLSGTAANVVVGNKDIADVNVIDSRNLMVVGKKFGVTNLVVLDAVGRALFDSEIVVSAGAGSVVSVSRGGQSADYACTPYCQQVAGDAAAAPMTPTIQTPGQPPVVQSARTPTPTP